MKVLFAVNNDDISKAIIKKYQKDFKEILSYKNVYYFNAILKELQKDKNYDRVVISEDLEPFANNNYDTIDRFLFDKLDKISDEAINQEGNNTEIVLICTDRRSKSDEMLTKLFGIGIYNAIIGQDRSIEEVCKLINKPRTKKDAKLYYKIETENVNYQAESGDSISEEEIQNILAHYKRLGKNEDKYVDSFNNIVSQYTDIQLKMIIRFLPISVKAVLEEKSPKYQELISFGADVASNKPQLNQYNQIKKTEQEKNKEKIKVKMIEEESNKSRITKPIIIPSGVNTAQVKRLIKEKPIQDISKPQIIEEYDEANINKQAVEAKKGRGRPKKIVPEIVENIDKPARKRGRPKKEFNIENETNQKEETDELIDLFNIEAEGEVQSSKQALSKEENPIDLFNLNNSIKEDVNLFELDEDEDEEEDYNETINNTSMTQTQYKTVEPSNFNTLITKDKKVVSFVGTTKNGTSFIVNNVAHMLASMGISTAILDMTKTKNAYYIYTNNEEHLMQTAKNSINKLKSGSIDGIKINKNLSVYTSVPEDDVDYNDVDSILSTLINNYSVVLIDCDFDTPMEYFEKSQEIYLVQSMDVLTIQPLTAFLRNLQSKGVLKQEKIKIVINKGVKIKSVSIKTLIGGICKYNDPSMTYMKDLFDKDNVKYCIISFEMQNYIKYLDSLITCSISLNGYTKLFISELKKLCDMIYPLINKQTYSSKRGKHKDGFSNEMNDTLSKMKANINQ
ncbi:MAG: hypothetical protein Q4G09_02880 [Clostridia bacterium]|nr:hypothetical protein [Clostridia bacterium]